MMNNDMKGIYIHIPFCVHKCIYCDFFSHPADDAVKRRYGAALVHEIKSTAACIAKQGIERVKVQSVFIGGGTPSVMPEGCIRDIMRAVRRVFDVQTDAEVTIECNPGTVDERKLDEYRQSGINRLSFGLQSADDAELKMLGRIHNFSDFEESYGIARNAGFDNINIDIMSAIPGQNMASLERTLRAVAGLEPEHMSVYSLIVEDGTPLAEHMSEYPPTPDEDEDRLMYHRTAQILAEYGFGRYEISNYSRAGFECRHNLLYWDRGEYLGFGCAAAGFMGEKRYSVIEDIEKYINLGGDAKRGELYENVEKMTREDALEEFMFLGLRKTAGIDVNDFGRRFGEDIGDVYGSQIASNIAKGLLKKRGDSIMLTPLGLDVCNTVMSDFILTA